MPVYPWSRYRYSYEYADDEDVSYIDEYEPFLYRDEADNRFHVAREGDTWWGLAHLYFQGIPRMCGMWWAIADFQPDRVIDPTLSIAAGQTVVIPSERLVRTKLFTPERRVDY